MIIKHKGTSIFYTDQGQGEPIVLLHGFLENSSMWNSFLPILTKTHRVICIDILGHGQSKCLGYIHTMTEMAQAIKSVIDILQLNDITIIGHSMGGYVGCAFAKAYPENAKAICLLNSTPDQDPEDRKILRARANKMAQTQFEQLVRMSFINLFDPLAKEAHEIEIQAALEEALKTPIQGYMAANEGMRLRPDSIDFWLESKIKKAMILGESDWIVDAQSHKSRFEKYSDVFMIIEGGHMSHISNKMAVTNSLLSFLSLKK